MSDMQQLLLIVNPAAGTKKAGKHLSEIISIFNRGDFDTRVYITNGKSDATNAVKQFGAAADLIVSCGGDGTLNETISGLIEAELNIPLGYIPAGSTNDFANTLKLSNDVIGAAKQIVEGAITEYDVGKFGDRFFSYVASFGAFTRASYSAPTNIKNTLGHVAYILEGIQELSSIRAEHVRVEIDGETLEDDYLFGAVCNSTSLGGILTLNPDIVDMSDGLFELLLVRAPKDVTELSECIVALKNQTYNCRMITFRSASKAKFFTKEGLAWSLDGEKAESSSEVLIENLHKRIRLVR